MKPKIKRLFKKKKKKIKISFFLVQHKNFVSKLKL